MLFSLNWTDSLGYLGKKHHILIQTHIKFILDCQLTNELHVVKICMLKFYFSFSNLNT